jgi:hypothetical protein
VIDNATTFRQLLGTTLEQLSVEERQASAQCLLSKVVLTGEDVEVHFVLPFDSTPRMAQRLSKAPEGTLEYFYRLRLAHFPLPLVPQPRTATELIGIRLAKLAALLTNCLIRHDHSAFKQ